MKPTIITLLAVFAMMSVYAPGANAQLSAPFAGGIKLQQGGAGSQSNGLIMKATAAAFNGGDYTLTWTAPPGSNGILKYTNTGASSGSIGMSSLDLTADVGTSILPIANGGTNSTAIPTNGGVSYGTGTAYAFTSSGTSGQLLKSNGAAAPTWVDASSFGITAVNGTAPVVVNTAAGVATVSLTQGSMTSTGSSISMTGAGKTVGANINADLNLGHSNTWTADQLLPADQAQGNNLVSAVNSGNTSIAIASGGTGVTALAGKGVLTMNSGGTQIVSTNLTDGQVLIGSTGNAPAAATLTAGTGITITNAPGSITISSNTNTTNKIRYALSASAYSYAANAPPAGFTLTATSVINVTVYEAGSYPMTATVTNIDLVNNKFDFVTSGYPTAGSSALVTFQN